MNSFVTSVVTVTMILAAMPAFAQVPNFSGMWTLDQMASDFTEPGFSGGRGGPDVERLFITHAKNGTVVSGAETNASRPGRTHQAKNSQFLWAATQR